MQADSFKKFLFWLFVGNMGGFALAHTISYLPFKDKSKTQIKKYQRITFFTSLLAFGYHGYKLSNRDFLRGKKELTRNSQYILTEPDDELSNNEWEPKYLIL